MFSNKLLLISLFFLPLTCKTEVDDHLYKQHIRIQFKHGKSVEYSTKHKGDWTEFHYMEGFESYVHGSKKTLSIQNRTYNLIWDAVFMEDSMDSVFENMKHDYAELATLVQKSKHCVKYIENERKLLPNWSQVTLQLVSDEIDYVKIW